MTYKEAITITYNFTNNNGKKSYIKTFEEMKTYAEACAFLKASWETGTGGGTTAPLCVIIKLLNKETLNDAEDF